MGIEKRPASLKGVFSLDEEGLLKKPYGPVGTEKSLEETTADALGPVQGPIYQPPTTQTPAPAPMASPAQAPSPAPAPAEPTGTPIKSFNSYYAREFRKRGYLEKRDLTEERKAIGIFGGQYGREPKSHDDWKLIHNALYGGTQFMDASPEDDMADALEEPGMEEKEEKKEETKIDEEDKFAIPTMDEILAGLGINKLEKTDFTDQFTALDDNLVSQIEGIDLRYEQIFIDEEKKNKKVLASLRAKLIRKGVPLDGPSYLSASASEIARGEERMDKLDRLKQQEISSAKRGKYQNFLTLSKQERDEAFDMNMADIDHSFKGQNLAMSIWDAFNSRDNAQKEREQQAQEHLDKTILEWAKLDSAQRADNLNMLETFIKDGLYDVNNESVVNMLYQLEEFNNLEQGTLVNAAVGGFWNRTSTIMLKSAQTKSALANAESALAGAEQTKALLPFKIEKYKADIAKSRAAATKSLQSSLPNEEEVLDTNNLLYEMETLFLGGTYTSGGQFEATLDENGNPMESAFNANQKMDSQKYIAAKTQFIEAKDPKLKNEKYYEGIFMDFFPPNVLLDEEEKSAQVIINQYKKKGEATFVLND